METDHQHQRKEEHTSVLILLIKIVAMNGLRLWVLWQSEKLTFWHLTIKKEEMYYFLKVDKVLYVSEIFYMDIVVGDGNPYHFLNWELCFYFFLVFTTTGYFFTIFTTNAYVISISNSSHIVTAGKIQMCYMKLQLGENHPVRSWANGVSM